MFVTAHAQRSVPAGIPKEKMFAVRKQFLITMFTFVSTNRFQDFNTKVERFLFQML